MKPHDTSRSFERTYLCAERACIFAVLLFIDHVPLTFAEKLAQCRQVRNALIEKEANSKFALRAALAEDADKASKMAVLTAVTVDDDSDSPSPTPPKPVSEMLTSSYTCDAANCSSSIPISLLLTNNIHSRSSRKCQISKSSRNGNSGKWKRCLLLSSRYEESVCVAESEELFARVAETLV